MEWVLSKNYLMISNLRSDFCKLRFQWKSYSKELQILEEINSNAIKEFYKEVMIQVDKKGLKNPFDQDLKEPKKESAEIFNSEEVKTIYRNIAKATHPDLNKDERTEDIFKKTSSAKKEGNLNKLYDCAKISKIKIESITYDHIEKMEKEINEIEKEIKKIKNSDAWLWYHENNKNRTLIINYIIKSIKND